MEEWSDQRTTKESPASPQPQPTSGPRPGRTGQGRVRMNASLREEGPLGMAANGGWAKWSPGRAAHPSSGVRVRGGIFWRAPTSGADPLARDRRSRGGGGNTRAKRGVRRRAPCTTYLESHRGPWGVATVFGQPG